MAPPTNHAARYARRFAPPHPIKPHINGNDNNQLQQNKRNKTDANDLGERLLELLIDTRDALGLDEDDDDDDGDEE